MNNGEIKIKLKDNGLLYKKCLDLRLYKKLILDKSDSIYNSVPIITKHPFSIEVEEALNEAKADFPNMAIWSKGYSYEYAQQKYLDTVDICFKKWFGEQ